MRKPISLVVLAAMLSFAVSASAQVIVLTRATVIDGTDAGPQQDATIVMENGRIRDIGPSSKIPTPSGAAVLDLTGKFIVPGIINAHGHVGAKTEPQLRQYALYGVTTATSMQTEQARKHGKLTFGHAYELSDARMLVEHGLNVLAHNVCDREVDSEFITMLKQRNVTLIPTLVRDELLFAYGEAPAWIDDPFFLKFVPPERLAVLKTKIRAEQAKHPQRHLIKAGFEMNKINLKKLSDGGVRVAFGTDSGGAADRFFTQGYSEHREMELMVQSGMTPMQGIQSFSKNASEALGIDKEFGTLAKGKAADLLVLEKNPLENITNMRTIQAIYLGGKKFE